MDITTKQTEDFELKIAVHCAPVLLGIKSSNALTLRYYEKEMLDYTLAGIPVKHTVLYSNNSQYYCLLYRSELISHILSKAITKKLLYNFGYESLQVNDVLRTLGIRYKHYRENGGTFPHEIGLILDYPPEDVLGFMRYNGRSSRFSGYWKVYYNVESAKHKFYSYDQARQTMINRLLNGENIKNIVQR